MESVESVDLVESVEANPDTRVHMTTGVLLIVQEDPLTVAQRIAQYRRSLLQEQRAPDGAFQLIQMAEEK